ncbi:MAG TPA: prephenate dehydratase domain-containing protein, partial [Candidatus Limnocylindrales bacterium]|nr:prephenate dehydratase domain-containing protein [Candidatus Limnocylindrales bacterium]
LIRIARPGFREVFEAVRDETAVAGVLPIENSVNGTVREVYDLFLDFELAIVGEVVVPVELCLAALPGQSIGGIERVYSHIQALGQAERYLRSQPWTLLTTYNTAGSGRLIAERAESGAAAVLSRRAAAAFGLEILAEGIQDVADNRTRFVVVASSGSPTVPGLRIAPGGPSRTTLAFAVRNEPGTLLQALKVFADRDVNLSSLESRPSRSVAWEYVFWVDLDAAAEEPAASAAIADLRAISTMVRVLGSYHRG